LWFPNVEFNNPSFKLRPPYLRSSINVLSIPGLFLFFCVFRTSSWSSKLISSAFFMFWCHFIVRCCFQLDVLHSITICSVFPNHLLGLSLFLTFKQWVFKSPIYLGDQSTLAFKCFKGQNLGIYIVVCFLQFSV
jgi:hypothetical protein